MPHSIERRNLLLGAAFGATGLITGSCSEGSSRESVLSSEIPTFLPQTITHEPSISTPIPTLTPTPEANVSEIQEKIFYDPMGIKLPSSDTEVTIEQGQLTSTGQLVIPDGGHILDFSRTLDLGNKTLVLTGHSRWQKKICPMGQTFELNKNDNFVVSDSNRGNIEFSVKSLQGLNWDKVWKLMVQDRTEGTVLMFTSLRADIRQSFEHYMPVNVARQKVDNPLELDGLYNKDDYLYWVVTSTEVTNPPEVF